MILDMNIKLNGIDEDFLEELDELIEDTRVEYFIINPKTKDELEKTLELCSDIQRFKYTLPIEFKENKDENCIAFKISKVDELDLVENMPIVIDSISLDDSFIDIINQKGFNGVVIDAKESDNRLEKFAYSISHNSLKQWSKKGITDTDFNKLALQSDYPVFNYDELLDGLLKDISDLTFRAEQSIASGGTRTVLKTFGLL
ncbi:hypothetical protein [Halarcobacter sp.]|uniref:hypothetical protein n=1 Tax=Halarcobacter sp. TaxID=2321133 RepID=UPI0029F4C7EB|nr:hypothetical protein [Halarcobacter sp.]